MIKSEEVTLKAYEIEIEGVVVRDDPEIRGKRKNFEELTSRTSKSKRVKNVVEILESDIGLKDKVLEKLDTRKEGDECDMVLICTCSLRMAPCTCAGLRRRSRYHLDH